MRAGQDKRGRVRRGQRGYGNTSHGIRYLDIGGDNEKTRRQSPGYTGSQPGTERKAEAAFHRELRRFSQAAVAIAPRAGRPLLPIRGVSKSSRLTTWFSSSRRGDAVLCWTAWRG